MDNKKDDYYYFSKIVSDIDLIVFDIITKELDVLKNLFEQHL